MYKDAVFSACFAEWSWGFIWVLRLTFISIWSTYICIYCKPTWTQQANKSLGVPVPPFSLQTSATHRKFHYFTWLQQLVKCIGSLVNNKQLMWRVQDNGCKKNDICDVYTYVCVLHHQTTVSKAVFPTLHLTLLPLFLSCSNGSCHFSSCCYTVAQQGPNYLPAPRRASHTWLVSH